jgi:hypothetical protein
MDDTRVSTTLDEIIERLRSADWKGRDAILIELRSLVEKVGLTPVILRHIDDAKKTLPLEVRWDLDEIVEAFTVAPAVEEEPEEDSADAEDPNKPLSMSDLNVVYDDPRGLILYKSKVGERWFAAQPDPHTGQPRMFELGAAEIQQLKTQLAGSPYWVLGAGGAA